MTSQPQTKTYYAVLFFDTAHKNPFIYLAKTEETNTYSAFYGLDNALFADHTRHAYELWKDQNFPIFEVDPNNPPTAEELARTVYDYEEVTERYLIATAGSPNPNGFIFDRTAALLQAFTLVRYNLVHQNENAPDDATLDTLDKEIDALLWQIMEVR